MDKRGFPDGLQDRFLETLLKSLAVLNRVRTTYLKWLRYLFDQWVDFMSFIFCRVKKEQSLENTRRC